MLDISLDLQEVPFRIINPEFFTSPLKRDLGGVGVNADIESNKLRLRIGRRPYALNLRRLYEMSERTVPSNFDMFMDYEIWLVAHAISIISETRFEKVKQLGYKVHFFEDSDVTVIDLFPQTSFIKRVGASWQGEASVQLNGQISIAESIAQVLNIGISRNLPLDGEIKISNHVDLVGKLSLSVMTPLVIAIGIGDRNSEWVLTQDDTPLLGDQQLVQIIITSKYTERVEFDAQVYATISGFSHLPIRLVSDWVRLSFDLCR